MCQEIAFRFQPSLLGSFDQPQPPIPHLAGVILWQHGKALVGAWDAEVAGFIHPVNQGDLEEEARTAILAAYPDADMTSDELRVFTCPEPIVARYDFGNWHEEWLRFVQEDARAKQG